VVALATVYEHVPVALGDVNVPFEPNRAVEATVTVPGYV
jgi:hypothetical protein